MTEHLSALLTREAGAVLIPPPPTDEIIGAGRRLRRRRTTTIWAGAALALVLVGAGAALVGTHRDANGTTPVTPVVTPLLGWAVGDTVYVGSEARAARMPEVAQTLYYTSAGILVRTNKDGSSDGGAPFHFELVRPDGTTTKLDVTLGEVVPATDPRLPYLAWATMTDGQIRVVVHDVSTDRDVATVDVPGTFDWGGWAAPPVSLAGDRVYVGTNGPTTVVDWRTGEATTSTVLPKNYFPEVHGGRTVTQSGRGQQDAQARVVDALSGRTVLDIPIGRTAQLDLSPDGRFLKVGGFLNQKSFQVYDVDTGSKVTVTGSSFDQGWTSDDHLFTVRGDRLTVCSAIRGDCTSSHIPETASRNVRYAGQIFES